MSRAYFAILALATALVVSVFWQTAAPRPFFYDEADYMYAGTRGIINNYLDRPSISTIEFVRNGLALARDKSQRTNMSKFVRSAGDITFYRHYHGPIYAYWIALWEKTGLTGAAQYRASGLLIHALVTLLTFWFFRAAFPEYPPIAALAAAFTVLVDRTALVAATSITQHGMFGLMAALTLLPLALFARSGDRRFWYLSAAALGVAFSTVETSFILVGCVLLVLGLEAVKTGLRPALHLLGRGTLVFLAAILAVWPQGVLTLGGLKGYIYLAYIALVKKTFTPMSPVALWSFKFRTYPEEFIIPILALIAATVFRKKLAAPKAVIPYLVYVWMFLGVTMVITAPYTYYHASLLVAIAVVVGVVFGELWTRGTAIRIGASVVLVASLGFMAVRHYRETAETLATHDPRFELLSYLKSDDRSRTVYVPYELVPTLHFYLPDLNTTGYDTNWTPDALTVAMAQGPAELLCEAQLCKAVAGETWTGTLPVMGADQELQKGALYSVAPPPPPRR